MQGYSSREPDWDFRPVLDVIEALKRGHGGNSLDDSVDFLLPDIDTSSKFDALSFQKYTEDGTPRFTDQNESSGYGSREFGGVPLDLPPISLLSWGPSSNGTDPGPDNTYTSDGVIQRLEFSKDPAWMSEGDAAPGNLNVSNNPSVHIGSGLTKNQRKKRNRRLRLAEAAESARRRQDDNEANDGDDDDSGKSNEQSHKLLKHAKASTKKENETGIKSQIKVLNNSAPSSEKTKPIDGVVPPATPQTIEQAKAKVAAATVAPVTSAHGGPKTEQISRSAKANHQNVKNTWPSQSSYVSQVKVEEPPKRATRFDPFITKIGQTQEQVHTTPFASTQSGVPSHSKHEILPLVNWTSVDRNWSLLSKLLNNFPDDRKYLVAPLQLSINRPQKKGIHVFVDASNILIGFYDHLKIARGIPKEARVKRVELNFHSLALLLERRRPITKRVLAGSMPEVPAFEQARQVGYETCILEKVFKTPYTSEKKRNRRSMGQSGALGYLSGSESAGNGLSANDNSVQAPAKWVEQAVDEVLHKKILESIVDVHIPPDAVTPYDTEATKTLPARPTMVLATGDAADAEYGSGFRDTVKRALKSGWMVEVMAFSKNISHDYRKMERLPQERGGWGDRFKIIELDLYAEELFGEGLVAAE